MAHSRAEQVRGGLYDTVVIGSGAGGLTAALWLTKRGRRVLVLEAAQQFGGMLNPFARHHFHFDVGLHYIGDAGPGQALTRILDDLGLSSIRFRELSPSGFDRYVFPSGEGKLMRGIEAFRDELCTRFAAEARAIQRFSDVLAAVQAIMRMGLSVTDTGEVHFRDVRASVAKLPELARLSTETLRQTVDRYFEDPLLKNIVCGPCGDIGLGPARLSSLMHLGVLADFLGGAYYPVGGTGPYRDAFVTALEAGGAELLRNQRVCEIQVDGPAQFRVRTESGAVFQARSVISNADAHYTLPMLRGRTPSARKLEKARNIEPSIGTVCVFMGVSLDPRQAGLDDANVWHYGSDDLDAIYRSIETGGEPAPATYFMTVPTLKDPESQKAPNGHHIVELISGSSLSRFARYQHEKSMRRSQGYEALKRDIADAMIDSAERHYLPGLRKSIVVQEIATPATVKHYVHAHAGGIYGPAHTPAQTLFRRFTPWVGVPGVTLAGSSVLGAGVVSCTVSGVAAAALTQRHLTKVTARSRSAGGFVPSMRASTGAAAPMSP